MCDFLKKIQTKIPSFFKREKGATMVEYAIMVGLIAIISYAIVTSVGLSTSTLFSTANSSYPAASQNNSSNSDNQKDPKDQKDQKDQKDPKEPKD